MTYDTILNLHTHKERALKGYDGDFRLKLPLHDDINFWLGAGYHRFKRASVKIDGPTATGDLEFKDVVGVNGSRFSIGYEYRKEKPIHLERHYAVVRLGFPLSSSGVGASLNGIDYQMTRMIQRDVDVKSATDTDTQNVPLSGVATSSYYGCIVEIGNEDTLDEGDQKLLDTMTASSSHPSERATAIYRRREDDQEPTRAHFSKSREENLAKMQQLKKNKENALRQILAPLPLPSPGVFPEGGARY